MEPIKKKILNKLTEIETKENVIILLAVESGSRAWGVASPDSDYDVRFIYIRPTKDYLCVRERKDIIEWQLDEVLDINGWDLKKALAQFHRGNATLFEWANSPVVYKTTDAWQNIYKLCMPYFSEKAALYHYYGTANSTLKQHLMSKEIKYKKYIYALRPLLACKYIETYHCIPPVLFEDLLRQHLPDELTAEIEKMLTVKTGCNEKELNPPIPVIQKYIEEETARYKQLFQNIPDDRNTDWETLDDIFLKTLENLFHSMC